MQTQLCSMCLREKAFVSDSEETEWKVQEILAHFEVPASLFQGSHFCPDCVKLLALTHQVSAKILKRKQAQDEPGKPPVIPARRRPSNETTLSLAKRMRLVQVARSGLKENDQPFDVSTSSANRSNDEPAARNNLTFSHSADEEYRSDGDEHGSNFRSRTGTC